MSLNYYQYQACDQQGNLSTGQLSAESEREAVAQLQARQLVPIRLRLSSRQESGRRATRITSADLVEFTNGLCTLVEARVPLDKALALLEGITEKEPMKRLVASIRREVKEGHSLASAMELRPAVFSHLYINMIRAGETGGILDQLLPDLAAYLESAEQMRKQLAAAMIYPLVLLLTGVLSVGLLLVYVVPQFTLMFEQVGSDIPASARFLFSLSAVVRHYGWLVLPLVPGVYLLWRWLRGDAARRKALDASLLNVPGLGKLLLYREVARFTRTLGALLVAGIPLIRGLRVAREVVGNRELVARLGQVEEDVRGGAGLGLSLARTGRFPPLLHQLVTVGEESGRSGEILKKLAVTFDSYVRDEMRKLVNALQPALILIMGVTVGGIIMVMLSAVFSMNTMEF